jgi:Flp pilus assembly protein TadG
VVVQYYIFGGTPPYTVAATFPGVVSLGGVPVLTNGGSFTATTNGSCFINMQYAISDATGRTIPGGASPLLTNEVGKASTTPPGSMTVSPATVTSTACTGKTFQFIVVGGTAPYSVTANPAGPIIAPSPVPTAGTPVDVSGLLTGSGVTTITFVDSSATKLIGSATITCS